MSLRLLASPIIGLAIIGAVGCTWGGGEQDQARSNASAGEPITVENDQDVFPAAFRGRWAPDEAICRDPDGKGVAEVTARRISEYESDAVLLKTALSFEQGPVGESADTVGALVALSGEGELGFTKFKISLAGDHLYLSREEASAAQHWSHPLIRCR